MARGVIDRNRGSLNKWEMYRVLTDEDLGPCLLPATFVWHPDTLPRYLQRYHSMYIKPLDAWGGHGISVIERVGATTRWIRQGRVHTVPVLSELCIMLAQVYPPGAAIVQQAAPLCRIDRCVFDIRVLMQRSATDQWVQGGMLARIGGENSVVSNVQSSGGSVSTVDTALRQALSPEQCTPVKLKQIEIALGQVSHTVCRILEPYRHFNEVGLDFGVDAQGQLWLIEVNTDDAIGGPSHELFAQLPDKRVYQQITKRKQAYDQATLQMVLDQLRPQ